MNIQNLGHVVLRCRNLERMTQFYHNVLGLQGVITQQPDFVFLTIPGEHHVMGLRRVDPQLLVQAPAGHFTSLHHFAFRIGDGAEVIEAAVKELNQLGVAFKREDNDFTQALVLKDPEGNTVELYADIKPAPWQEGGKPIPSA